MSSVASTVIRFHEYGEPVDVLREERAEVGDPGSGRVRVRVVATGLNPADWELCRGFMAGSLPRGIGYDVCGTVDALGDDVDDVGVGDLVFGTADFLGQPSAGAAELAILDGWYPVPEGLDPVDAAVLPMVVQTAVWTLDAMDVEAGSTLLVNGAGAMVGFAATQVALRRGVRVIATAGSTFATELEGLGARVTSYGEGMAERVRELAGGPVDHVFDAPPPREGTIAELLPVTTDPSRIMTISNHDEARRLGAKVNLDAFAGGLPTADFLPRYAALTVEGAFRLPIAQTFALEQWRDAVTLSTSGHPHGKVVLLPASGD